MKKLLPIILLTLLAACGNEANTNDHDNNTPTTANDKPSLQLVFSDSTYQLTGVAVSRDGRLFTNYPLWSDTYKYALVEITGNNQVKPYPNPTMNSWQPGTNGQDKWVCVQAVYIDDSNTMWVVDPAAPKLKTVYEQSYKLVKINLATNTVERTYTFNGVISDTSYINDVRVDTARQYAYLTNSKDGGIVVVNLRTGKAREVLHKHPSTQSDPRFQFTIDGHELMKDGKPAKFNSDGIALTPDGSWLYYKPLTDSKLYRVKTEDLRNEQLTGEALSARVEDLGNFNTTDGMIFDKQGNLYMGDLQQSSIVQVSPQLKVKTIIQDDRLIWPDSYSISPDGYLYISCSQIQKQPDYNNGINKRTTPYTIYKMKLPR